MIFRPFTAKPTMRSLLSGPRLITAGRHVRSGVIATLGLLGMGASWAGAPTAWGALSDVLAVGMPVAAAGHSWMHDDNEGLMQLGLSLGASYAGAELIKKQHHAMRPDGSGDDSFPSAHAAVAFSAARYMDKRYGFDYGKYMYAAAGVTAFARVEARKHYWKDVIAGGALGFVMSELTTSSRSVQLSVLPTKGGLSVMALTAW